MLCAAAKVEGAVADPWCWRLWFVGRCPLTERGTSTPETCLGLCLSCCFEKCGSCFAVFMPRLCYCPPSCSPGAKSSWKSCKMTVPVFQPRIPVAAPWLGLVDSPRSCWATGALWQTVKLQTKPFPFLSFPLITFPWLFQSPLNTQAQPYRVLWGFWRHQ